MKHILLTVSAILALHTATPLQAQTLKINGEKVKVEQGIYAQFNTTVGQILIKLETEKAPMTAGNFIALAEGNMPHVDAKYKGKKYFDGLGFHRVINDFMIQGGDPAGNGMGGPGYEFPNETSPELTHEKGVISMANAGPNTNGSQFFITVNETHFLDGNYSVFGKVVAGQWVADSISKTPRNAQDKPNTDMVMKTIVIHRVGKTFKKWDAVAAFDKGKNNFEAAKKLAEEEAKNIGAKNKSRIDGYNQQATETESGLRYVILDQGKGPKPQEGEAVNINYAGYFMDGILFDSSIPEVAKANNAYNAQRPYGPMEMPYSMSAGLITGFKEGMLLINKGGKVAVIIPPHLAYGEQGAGGIIPPNATLYFEIELVND